MWSHLMDLTGLAARELVGKEREQAMDAHFANYFADTQPILELVPIEEDRMRRALAPRAAARRDAGVAL